MNVNTDTLIGLRTNFRAIFQKTLAETAGTMTDYTKISTYFKSDTEQEVYDWLGEVPSMSEWTDERRQRALNEAYMTIVNKHYEATLGVDRDKIEDDKLGQYAIRIRGLAVAALRYYNEAVFNLLNAGHTGLAYDGSIFFGTTRTIGKSAAIVNYSSGNYSDSDSEIRTGLQTAIAYMRSYQDEYGKPINLVPDTIVCSPTMELPIKDALVPGVAGVVRPEMSYVKNIISSPFITSGSGKDWFVLCTTAEVNPLIFQMRKPPEFDALDNPNDSYVFLKKKFLYGVDTRFNVGYADPRTAIMLVNT